MNDEIDQKIAHAVENDVNVVQSSLGYWYLCFEVIEELLQDPNFMENLKIWAGKNAGNFKRIRFSVSQDKLQSLTDVENILTLEESEKVLNQVRELEKKEFQDKYGRTSQNTFENIRRKEKDLSAKLTNLVNERQKIAEYLRANHDSSKMKELAREGSNSKSDEQRQIAKSILIILEQLEQVESQGRRKLIKATGVAALGLKTISEEKVQSKFNEKQNEVAFKLIGVDAKSPEQMYREKPNMAPVDAAIQGGVVNIAINNLVVGEGKHRKYPNQEISDYIKNQFREGLGINVEVIWNNRSLENYEIDGVGNVGDILNSVDLRNLSEEERYRIGAAINSLGLKLGETEEIAVVINNLNMNKFSPRAVLVSSNRMDTVMIDDVDKNTLMYVLLHELGHSLCLPHNKGSDVMSYSIKRFVKGELGVLNNAFQEESLKNWQIIKDIY